MMRIYDSERRSNRVRLNIVWHNSYQADKTDTKIEEE